MNTRHTIKGYKKTAGVNQSMAGFTLVELIVAVAIFTLVSTSILGSLLSVISASRQQQAKGEAVDSLNFVVDDMMRRIRTGYNFRCGIGTDTGDGDDCSDFTFTASEVGVDASTNPRISYRENGGQLIKLINGGSGGTQTLTGPPLDITDLTFIVTGSDGSDDKQSRVQLSITGEVEDTVSGNIQEFRIQTTIAQRLLYPPRE
jgi:prepilin-type N-terminal cleavage/methylation domain-containing protein